MKQYDSEEISLIGRDEMNLIEFPFALLNNRNPKGTKTIMVSGEREDNGKKIEWSWKVSGSLELGLPLPFDQDVFLGLLYLGSEKGFSSSTIEFTRSQLCNILGINRSERTLSRIKEAVLRLVGTEVIATDIFWDKKRRKRITRAFHILENADIYERDTNEGMTKCRVKINDVIFESITEGYLKKLNLSTYYKLESEITKRLYRYLDKKRGGMKQKKEKCFTIGIRKLAFVHLGFDRDYYKYDSKIKERLDQAHKELISINFLTSAEYKEGADKNETVIYTFVEGGEPLLEPPALERETEEKPEQDPAPSTQETATEENQTEVRDPLVDELMALGVSQGSAIEIVWNFSEEVIREQMKALEYRNPKEPGAMLLKAIRENWSLPKAYLEKQNEQEAVRKHREREDQVKVIEDERQAIIETYLQDLTPEELEHLVNEAKNLAKSQGGKWMQDIGIIPEPMLDAYKKVVVADRLGLKL